MHFIKRILLLLLVATLTIVSAACGHTQSKSDDSAKTEDKTVDYPSPNNAEITAKETPMAPTQKEKPDAPYIGMKESEIQNTKLGVPALTYESGGFWGGEAHTFNHYTFYYRYSTHTDVVFSCRANNGVIDEIEDRRDAPISVDKDRHKTMIAAGVPVNYK